MRLRRGVKQEQQTPGRMSAAGAYLAALLLILGANTSFSAAVETPPVATSLTKQTLTTNLTEPIQLSIDSVGKVFIAERGGSIKVWEPQSASTRLVGKLDVSRGSEDGLLSIVLDPGFSTNRWIYAFHSTPGILENRVSRFTLSESGTLDLGSQKVLLHIPTILKKPNHSGGGLGFDNQGNLYASTGDYTFINDSDGYSPLDQRPGREFHDSERTAANTNDPRGKILRIHPEPDGSYTIPVGNLFPPGTPKTLPEIYIMGCRNPFRFALHPETRWLLWGDIGPDAKEPNPTRGPTGFDEFNLAKQAGNFGWPYFSADNKPYIQYDFATKQSGSPFNPQQPVNHSPNNTGLHELPAAQPALLWYPPGPTLKFSHLGSGARSAMAGAVYRFNPSLASTAKLPVHYDNAWFVFDWERNWINTLQLDPQGKLLNIDPFAPHLAFKRPISLGFGPDGALYVIEWGSQWWNNHDAQLSRVAQN